MKISGTLVILTPGFAASEEDSTCLPMQQSLVRTLGDLYPQLKIIVLSFQYPYCRKTYTWHKATVYSFNGRNKGGLQRLLLRRTILQTLKKLQRSEDIVGLLSFWYGECAAVGHLFGSKYGIHHRCWLLGQDARKGNSYPSRYSLPSNGLIALSDFLQEEFQRNHNMRPARLVTPAINPQHFPLQAAEKDIDLLGVGSFIPLKQYDLFVNVVAEIKKERPDVKAVLIGGGPESQRLKRLIEKHSLQNNLQLAGESSNQDVLKAMQRTRVFLHPSSYEGFGVVCLEALYAGADVISFVQPMKGKIESWHIAKGCDDMIQIAKTILNDDNKCYASRLPFAMKDTAGKLISSFVS